MYSMIFTGLLSNVVCRKGVLVVPVKEVNFVPPQPRPPALFGWIYFILILQLVSTKKTHTMPLYSV